MLRLGRRGVAVRVQDAIFFFFFGDAALVRLLKNISDNGNTGPKLALLSALGLFIYLFIIFISQNSKLPSYLK